MEIGSISIFCNNIVMVHVDRTKNAIIIFLFIESILIYPLFLAIIFK